MFNLNSIIRPNILALKAYSSARDEYKGSEGIFLDANENPYGSLNRYPDPNQLTLKSMLAERSAVKKENVFIGNGSDELIDLAFRIFCIPGKDKAFTFSPTYGMYNVSAAINDVELIESPLDSEFQINLNLALATINKNKPKLIFICSPNNPTGNTLRISDIESILNSTNGIVIIDEAYIDFSNSPSWLTRLNKFPNLIILQTFSKARGLASARIGIGYSTPEIIALLNKAKPPYNVSQLNQTAAIQSLNNEAQYQTNLKLIIAGKKQLELAFQQIRSIKKIYPSEANFILIKIDNAELVYNSLCNMNIITRNRSAIIANTLRISVGSKEENEELINALKTL